MPGYELTPRSKSCPSCKSVLPLDAVLCTRCGLNLATGQRLSEPPRDPADAARKQPAKPTHPCPSCGYDLTGLTGKPCPECGGTAEGRRKGGRLGEREERREREIASYWRNTFLIAAIGLLVGLALTFGVGIGLKRWDLATCALHFGLCQVGLFIGYFALCFFFLGFEEDVRGLALRLLGVAAVWAGLWMLVLLLPAAPFYGILFTAAVTVVTLVVPLQALTGRDWNDCYWIAGAAWVVRFVTGVVLFSMLGP